MANASPPKVVTNVTPSLIITQEQFWSTKFSPIKSTWGTAERTREKRVDNRFTSAEMAESWRITSDYGTQRSRVLIEQTIGKILSIPGPSEYSPNEECTSKWETAPKVSIKSRPWEEVERRKQSKKVPPYILPKKSVDDNVSVTVPWPQGPAFKGKYVRDPRRPSTPVPQQEKPGENLVGPGYYEPSIASTSTFETAPKIGFGNQMGYDKISMTKPTVPRTVIELHTGEVKERHNTGSSSKDNPGVGAYTVGGTYEHTSNAHYNARAISIAEKREFMVGQPKKIKIPGPGSYDVYKCSRFGGPDLIAPKSPLCQKVSQVNISSLLPPSQSTKIVQRTNYVSQYAFPKKKQTLTVNTNLSNIKFGE